METLREPPAIHTVFYMQGKEIPGRWQNPERLLLSLYPEQEPSPPSQGAWLVLQPRGCRMTDTSASGQPDGTSLILQPRKLTTGNGSLLAEHLAITLTAETQTVCYMPVSPAARHELASARATPVSIKPVFKVHGVANNPSSTTR